MSTVRSILHEWLVAAMAGFRVFILYNHHLFARGVESLLNKESGVEVIGMERDNHQALERIRRLQPDVVLLDCSTRPEEPCLTVSEVFGEAPNTRVISLNLRENGIDVYDKRRIIASEPADLLRVIRRGSEAESGVEVSGAFTLGD